HKPACQQAGIPDDQLKFERACVHALTSSPIEYPAPRTVRINFVGNGSSTLLRRWRTYTSTMLVRPSKLSSHTCSMIIVRERTRPACDARYSSKEYSLEVSSIRFPPRRTCWPSRSSSRSPTRRTLFRVEGCLLRRARTRT